MKRDLIKKIGKKVLNLFMVFTIVFASIETVPFMKVFADNNTKLIIQSNGNTITIDETDTNKLVYKKDGIMVGSAKVKLNGAYLTPEINNNNIEYTLTEYNNELYQVQIEVTPEDGYKTQQNYFYAGSPINFPGDNILNLDIDSNNIHTVDFSFEAEESNNDPEEPNNEPSGPTDSIYPIVAYFEGIQTGIEMNEEGKIILPDNWATGKVTFKAKVCTVNGVIAPDNGINQADAGSQQEIEVRIEGISNLNQLNETVTGSNDRSYVTFKNGFDECGKAVIQITSVEENGPINTIINIIDKNIVYLIAQSPLAMSMSVGSAEVSEAIVTKNVEKNLSIFFGNTKTTLKADGLNVDRITGVTGGKSFVLNEDGTATIQLPNLSSETTTKVNVTILLKDGKSITRTVNIKRTALLLNYDKFGKRLSIGYVMNKTYLYNNQIHNDNIFNAYVQVVLYKGDTVAGFKQVKIDDEAIINSLVNGTKYNGMNLPSNGSWDIETFDNNSIKIDLNSINGITKASVFLTDGPIDVNSNTLPSIEFGIGSGVEISWEVE